MQKAVTIFCLFALCLPVPATLTPIEQLPQKNSIWQSVLWIKHQLPLWWTWCPKNNTDLHNYQRWSWCARRSDCPLCSVLQWWLMQTSAYLRRIDFSQPSPGPKDYFVLLCRLDRCVFRSTGQVQFVLEFVLDAMHRNDCNCTPKYFTDMLF